MVIMIKFLSTGNRAYLKRSTAGFSGGSTNKGAIHARFLFLPIKAKAGSFEVPLQPHARIIIRFLSHTIIHDYSAQSLNNCYETTSLQKIKRRERYNWVRPKTKTRRKAEQFFQHLRGTTRISTPPTVQAFDLLNFNLNLSVHI